MGGVSRSQELTSKKRDAFLKVLRESGNVSRAARTIGFSRTSMYSHRGSNEEFSRKWNEAVEEATDELEEACRQRALHGVEEPVFGKTGQIGTKTKHSDVLAIFMLKGNRPEKYRERYELSGDPNRPLKVQEVSDAHLEAIVANGIAKPADE